MKNKKGFTLVELLAVIVVLALLALLAGNAVGNIIAKSQWNTFRTDALTIIKAGESAYSIDVLEDPSHSNVYTCQDLKDGGYLDLDNDNYYGLKTGDNAELCKVTVGTGSNETTLILENGKYGVNKATDKNTKSAIASSTFEGDSDGILGDGDATKDKYTKTEDRTAKTK